MPPEILSPDELAFRLGCSAKAVRQWAKDGQIPCIRDERRGPYFSASAVIDALRPERPRPLDILRGGPRHE